MSRGFTLIQISILLVVASLVLVAVLPSTRTTLNANQATTNKMNGVLTAMRGYEATHAALPCPADASQPIGGTSYGVAAANPGTGSPGNCTGGSPAANYVDTTNNVAVGLVPVRTLGLSNDYALDAYGRDITYAVDTNATVCFSGSLPGKITVTDNGANNNTIAALISHGPDGHGAWVPLTGSSGTAVRLNSGASDTNELLNAHVNSSFVPYTPLTNFVKTMPTATFNDLLVYKSSQWNLNATPAAAAPLVPTVTPPANGPYYTGQTLTFLVTYGSAVTVTGTPQLNLSIPQTSGANVARTASYLSTSGNTATFTYTVQSSDYAPTAPSTLSISSPISLNGGTISVGGAAACLSFTPPSLTGVLLNPVVIYTPDGNNNRVQWFSSNGGYVGQFAENNSTYAVVGIAVDTSSNVWTQNWSDSSTKFSNTGTLLTTISNNFGTDIKIDAAGHIWASEASDCVEEFNPTGGSHIGSLGGAYSGQYCATGSGIGEFGNMPAGIWIDSGGNFWVVDSTNNRVEKFNSSGTYQMTIGGGASCTSCVSTSSCTCATGTGNGKFNGPDYVAVDSAGNVFVTDYGNAQVQAFSSTGTFLRQWGSLGGANGQFGGNWAGPMGISIDPSGNVWVVDGADNRVEEFNGCGQYINSIGAGYNGVTGSQGSSGSANGQFGGTQWGPTTLYITPNTPGYAGTCIVSVTPPANGLYSPGQALTFTVTYNAAVTVTGTPQLVLTIGSNTRYANYLSGSGTTSLTFTYTVQSSDSSAGIALASSINLNGGTITSGGYTVNGNFTPPSMGGVLVNESAFMLVADFQNNRVQKLDLLGNYIFQIGACTSGACSALQGNGQLYNPYNLAVDGSGNIWVADSSNSRVQEFSSTGTWLASLGGTASACTACLCTGPSTCPTSPGSGNGQMWGPWAVAIDGSGNIWEVDSSNKRVQEFSSSGTYLGQVGTTGVSGCAANEFTLGQYIHLDSSGNVYVADATCGQIQEFTSGRGYVKTFGPTIPGYGTVSNDLDDFSFDSCGNIWWQDEGNSYYVQTDYAGNFMQKVAGFGNGGMQSLGIDSTGKIYSLEENGLDVIDTFNSSGTYLGYIGAGSGTGNAQFNEALGMAIIGSAVTRLPHSSCPAVILSAAGPTNGTYTTGGTLGFAVTYDQAVTVTGTPQISVIIGGNTRKANYISGSGTTTLTFQYTVVVGDNAQTGITMSVPIGLNSGTISSNSIASDLYFQPPTLTGVLVNPANYSNFYIADTSNHRVRLVTASTGFISTVAGTGTSGTPTAGAATSSKLNAPQSVWVDTSGNLYIADSGNHEVLKVNSSGTLSIFAGTGTSGTVTAGAATSSKLSTPVSVSEDSSANVYIADSGNHEVLKVNASGTLSVFAGTGTSGTVTAGAATSSNLNSPVGVSADSFGNVFIADSGNHEILKVASGTLSIYAGTGSSGSTHDNDGSLATAAKLKTPSGVAEDSSDNVYIADSGNDVILKVTASSGKIALFAGTNGSAGYSGDGGAATSAQLDAAKGVAVDTSLNVYIADTTNNVIRWVDTYGNINTVAGNGTAGYSGDGAAATSAEIKAPAGLATSR